MIPVFLRLTCLLLVWLVPTLTLSADTAERPEIMFLSVHSGPGLSLHKEMFMLPATWSDGYNGMQTEAVFQVSAKHRLFASRFYFAYTQISFWQAWDYNHSAPFRETNYNPEIFYRTKLYPFHSGFWGADIGFEHESNGQSPPISRSWNLIYVSPYYLQGHWLLYLKLRYRIPEDEKEFPEDMTGDDNPDITDYYGYTDFHVQYKAWHGHLMHFLVRGNLRTGKGYASILYTIPLPKSERGSLGIRLSHGYGESLVDYNRELTRLGVGVVFDR